MGKAEEAMIAALLLAQVLPATLLDVIAIGGSKHLLGVPTFVTSGAMVAEWSPDGTQLFALTFPRISRFSEPPKTPPRAKIVFWSTRQKKVLSSLDFPDFAMRPEIKWEGPSGSVILTCEAMVEGKTQSQMYRARPGGKWERLWTPSTPGYAAALTSEKIAGVLLLFQPFPTDAGDRGDRTFYWLAPGAREGVPVPVPDPKVGIGPGENWNLPVYNRGGRGMTYLVFNPANGFRSVDRIEPPVPPCLVSRGQAAAKLDKRIVNFESLWLLDTVAFAGDHETKAVPPFATALIAPKASLGGFTTTGSSVFYLDEGNLFVRSLTKISDRDMDLILEEEEKRQLKMECAQIAAALQLYWADHDGQMPTSSNIREALTPYLKGIVGFLDGFVLSYRGPENAFEVKDNQKEIIGYKEGRFGRMTVYADTHSKWERIRK